MLGTGPLGWGHGQTGMPLSPCWGAQGPRLLFLLPCCRPLGDYFLFLFFCITGSAYRNQLPVILL